MFPAERFHPTSRRSRISRFAADAGRNFPIRAEVGIRSSATGRSRLSLLITALTYIRGARVAAEAAIHGERHACVESDSALKKRSIASRAHRDHLSLRSSWRAHERSWNTRCSLHAYLLDSYADSSSPSTWNQAFLNISRCLSTCRLPAAILFPPIPPPRSDCVLLYVRTRLETTQRFTFISYVRKVREDETRRRAGCYAQGRELRASSLDRLPRSYGVFKSHATGNRFRSRFVWMDREGGGGEGGGFLRVSI